MNAHPNLYMSLRPVPPGVTAAAAVNLRLYNTMMTSGIERAWLELLENHPDRFVLGSDSFILPPSVPRDSPLVALSRGSQPRLHAANQLLAWLPNELARSIGEANAARLYRV